MMPKPIRAVELHNTVFNKVCHTCFEIVFRNSANKAIRVNVYATFVVFNSIFWQVCKSFLSSSWEKVYRSRL